MKLFGHPESGHAFKVRFFVVAANIDHEYEEIDIFKPRESRPAIFRDNSRHQEVPLLIDDGQPYIQSNAILIHLGRQTGQWGTEDPQTFNRCLEWLFWEANKIGMCLPQLRAANRFAKIEDEAHRWLSDRYESDIHALETELADGRAFIVGDKPTIADFSLCGYLYFAEEANVIVPGHVAAWLKRLSLLPGWQHPYELLRSSGNSAGSHL